MAITGSTRMQATTTELLAVGAALETAIAQFLQDGSSASHAYASVGMAPALDMTARSTQQYRSLFRRLLDQLSSPQAVAAIARLVELEEQVYRDHGLVTATRQGMMVEYELADRHVIEALDLLRGVLRDRIQRNATLINETESI